MQLMKPGMFFFWQFKMLHKNVFILFFRWGILKIETSNAYPSEFQAYAAGYVEGI